MYILVALVVVLLLILLLFTSRTLSPIPYFPSNKKDMGHILKALDLRDNQTVVDLGAGDGIVIFEAAKYAFRKKLNTKFVAIDINPILVFIMNIRKFFHPNKKNIAIMLKDIFEIAGGESGVTSDRTRNNKKSVSNTIVFYLYISPWYLGKIYRTLQKGYKSFTLVSYFYPLPKQFKLKPRVLKGVHDTFIYYGTHSRR